MARAAAEGGGAEAVTSDAIAEAIPSVVDPEGEAVHAGPEGMARALELIEAGEPLRYEGVIGPVSFDEFGDITGPFRLWRIEDGVVTTTGEMSAEEVGAIKAEAGGLTPEGHAGRSSSPRGSAAPPRFARAFDVCDAATAASSQFAATATCDGPPMLCWYLAAGRRAITLGQGVGKQRESQPSVNSSLTPR